MKQSIETLLKPHRDRIDGLDQKIVELLCERFKVIHEVGALKARHNIPSTINERVKFVIDNAAEMAAEQGDDDDLIREIYHMIVELSCSLEDDIIAATDIVTPKSCNG